MDTAPRLGQAWSARADVAMSAKQDRENFHHEFHSTAARYDDHL
jgi:hypothetical protein